jgi:hypothetical protein
MKQWLAILLLSSLSVGCLYGEHLRKEHVVDDWAHQDVKSLNAIIERARSNNRSWVDKIELYPHKLFDLSGLKQVSYTQTVDNIESAKNATIEIVRDGFLDDSVRGDIHVIELEKTDGRGWTVVSHQTAQRCWRSDSEHFSDRPCL